MEESRELIGQRYIRSEPRRNTVGYVRGLLYVNRHVADLVGVLISVALQHRALVVFAAADALMADAGTCLALIILTVAVNLMANFVAPIYTLARLFPRTLTFRRAAIISAVTGLVILPWNLYNSPARTRRAQTHQASPSPTSAPPAADSTVWEPGRIRIRYDGLSNITRELMAGEARE